MHKPDHLTPGWCVLVGLLMRVARLAPRWLLPAAVLAVGMVLGIPFHTSVLQAQDGGAQIGRQAIVTYYLDFDRLPLDRLCLGDTAVIPVSVKQRVLLPGDPIVGRIETTGGITAASDMDFLRQGAATNSADSSFPDVPLQIRIPFTGVGVGDTDIEFTATVRNNAERSPVPDTFELRATMPVRVVPCQFKVDVTSFWVASMYNADVLVSANIVNARLTSNDGHLFYFENSPLAPNFLRWDITTNRIRGCSVWHQRDRLHEFEIRGELLDNRLGLVITFPEMSEELYCNREVVKEGRVQNCTWYIDEVCETGRHPYTATPMQLEMSDVPLEGVTRWIDHTLMHNPGGSTAGRTTVTITLVEH
jgi:hypothetical protein